MHGAAGDRTPGDEGIGIFGSIDGPIRNTVVPLADSVKLTANGRLFGSKAAYRVAAVLE
jgi:hypothetical protein